MAPFVIPSNIFGRWAIWTTMKWICLHGFLFDLKSKQVHFKVYEKWILCSSPFLPTTLRLHFSSSFSAESKKILCSSIFFILCIRSISLIDLFRRFSLCFFIGFWDSVFEANSSSFFTSETFFPLLLRTFLGIYCDFDESGEKDGEGDLRAVWIGILSPVILGAFFFFRFLPGFLFSI